MLKQGTCLFRFVFFSQLVNLWKSDDCFCWVQKRTTLFLTRKAKLCLSNWFPAVRNSILSFNIWQPFHQICFPATSWLMFGRFFCVCFPFLRGFFLLPSQSRKIHISKKHIIIGFFLFTPPSKLPPQEIRPY